VQRVCGGELFRLSHTPKNAQHVVISPERGAIPPHATFAVVVVVCVVERFMARNSKAAPAKGVTRPVIAATRYTVKLFLRLKCVR
jgi:hypothetical protein